MKKSNKILLGGLLTFILILAAINVALYARYKSGQYVAFTDKEADEAATVNEFPNARQINIRHLRNVVIRVGDKLRVEQFGEDDGNIALSEKGGVVELASKDSSSIDRIFDYVIVYVPNNSTITAHKAQMRVEDNKDQRISYLNFSTSGGVLSFQQQPNALPIDSLNVQAANKATVDLQSARINKLSVSLNTSELIDPNASINQFILNADSVSRVSLQSKHLLKINN
jgi:hypothetical protein